MSSHDEIIQELQNIAANAEDVQRRCYSAIKKLKDGNPSTSPERDEVIPKASARRISNLRKKAKK